MTKVSIRGDAIKAVQVAALKKWAPRMDGLTTWEAGVVVDAVEPFIRAAERERLVRTYDGSAAYAAIAAERDAARATLTDLRAKVEEWDKRYTLVEVSDVLALFPEEVSE